MADSFFGFDTSISLDDDGGGGLEDSEEDYDAFNSETFDAAIKGDWEYTHENLVLLDKSDDMKEDENDEDDSDLEINFSRVGMDDFDVAKEDTEGRIQLDPSVWANPPKPPPNNHFSLYQSPDFLRHNMHQYAVPQPIQQSMLQQQQQQQNHHHHQMNSLLDSLQSGMPTIPPPHKIISVEDIERSIRNQQKQAPAKFEPLRSQTPQHPSQNQMHQQVPFTRSPSVPPGLPPPKGPLFPAYHSQLPTNNNLKPIRLPPGFPPSMQLMGQHTILEQWNCLLKTME